MILQVSPVLIFHLDVSWIPGDFLLQPLETLLESAHVEQAHGDVVADHLGPLLPLLSL